MWERNGDRTKASFGVGKSMTKNKGIIAQSAQHNRNVLINERSIKDRGNIGVVNVRNMVFFELFLIIFHDSL